MWSWLSLCSVYPYVHIYICLYWALLSFLTKKKKWLHSYLPDLVIIISVPRSWNLFHSSFVSNVHVMLAISTLPLLLGKLVASGDFGSTTIGLEFRLVPLDSPQISSGPSLLSDVSIADGDFSATFSIDKEIEKKNSF